MKINPKLSDLIMSRVLLEP